MKYCSKDLRTLFNCYKFPLLWV